MHCGVEVTESSTNKQHHLSLGLRVFLFSGAHSLQTPLPLFHLPLFKDLIHSVACYCNTRNARQISFRPGVAVPGTGSRRRRCSAAWASCQLSVAVFRARPSAMSIERGCGGLSGRDHMSHYVVSLRRSLSNEIRLCDK